MSDSTGFQWVQARFECSPTKAFQQVKLGVEADVKARMSTLPANESYGFSTASAPGSITAYIQANRIKRSVTFDETEDGISVRDENDKVLLKATLTLNNEAQCRLRIKEQEYELWQFRKLALEALLFGYPWR